jgi:hypothetical protein
MDGNRIRPFAGRHQPVRLGKSARALAGRLRRAQSFLRTLGIEIVFGREGRSGTRTITITAGGENRLQDTVSTVSTVSRVSDHGRPTAQKPLCRRWNTRMTAQTMLTVLTRVSGYEECALAS